MTRVLAVSRRTFASLRIRNFRLFFAGQLVSLTGTWLQSVAQAWLVLRLSGSGVAVGTVTGLQFVPMLVAGPWGGVLADRLDKRRTLIGTQAAMGVVAGGLTVVTAAGLVELWMVYLAALLTGCATVFDVPARQAFVSEMVGREALPNAIGLNSAMFNAARVVGPAVAGVLLVTVGIWPCFLVNTLSFVAVILGLRAMRVDELRRAAPAPRARGQIREGLRYVWQSRERRVLVIAVAVVGVTALNFQVVLPLLTRYTFRADAGVFGTLSAVMGAGSLVGALAGAARARPSPRLLVGSCAVAGFAFLGIAAVPTLAVTVVLLVPLGAGVMAFLVTANSLLQLQLDERMRGRVMSLYALVLMGSTPVGGPAMGWLAEAFGPEATLAVGGLGMLATAMLVVRGFEVRAGAVEGRAHGVRLGWPRRGRGAGSEVVGEPEPSEAAAA